MTVDPALDIDNRKYQMAAAQSAGRDRRNK